MSVLEKKMLRPQNNKTKKPFPPKEKKKKTKAKEPKTINHQLEKKQKINKISRKIKRPL